MSPPRETGSPVLVRLGVVCFALGLIAVAVVFGLFATGAHDLPLWLNLAAMLAPVGFGLALLGLFRQARRPVRRRPTPSAAPGGTEPASAPRGATA